MSAEEQDFYTAIVPVAMPAGHSMLGHLVVFIIDEGGNIGVRYDATLGEPRQPTPGAMAKLLRWYADMLEIQSLPEIVPEEGQG